MEELSPADMLTWGMGALMMIGALVFAFMPSGESKALNRRVARVAGDTDKEEKDAPKIQLRRQQKDSSIAAFDRFIKNVLPNPEKIRARLAATGLSMTISEYLLITLITICVFFAAFNLLLNLKLVLALLLSLTLGVFFPHAFIGMMGKRRSKAFMKFFPESIDTMVRGIRSGLPISESINTVASEMPDPIGLEFRTVRDSVRMGRSLDAAMWDVAKRIDLPEYRYLIIAMSIQKETGGNLSETLSNVADVLRKRRHMKLKIKAMSSEAKASAMILGALPFIVTLVLSVVSPEYITILFTDPRGNILVGVALGVMSMGIYIMSQMINFEI